MKKLALILILAILILSACGVTANNADGYYNVTLKAGGLIICQHISWSGDWLHCDNRLPLYRSAVWSVYFVAGAK